MSDSRPSSTDEKTTLDNEKKRFFWQKSKSTPKTQKDVDEKDSLSESTVAPEPVEPELTPVGFTDMFSTKLELFMDFIGLIAAAAGGSAQVLMTLLFSKLTQSFVSFQTAVDEKQPNLSSIAAGFRSEAALDAMYLTFIGVAMLQHTFTCTFGLTRERINAKRIRENYLRAVLRQDIQFFDKVGAGEVATRIQTDTHLVQQGMSEKVASSRQLSFSVLHWFHPRIRSKLAIGTHVSAMSSILPCIGGAGAVMNKFVSKYMQMSLKSVADGGTLAEEVISTIRTAQAFGTQSILAGLYDKHIDDSQRVDSRAAIFHGCGLATFFFIIYSSYGLAFYFGTTLILDATSGEVINVFMAILIGSFSLAMMAPEMQAITHGRGAAAKLFATIDRVPAIDSADPSGLKPEHVEGEITLENIKFSYPSRPGVIVVKDLSLNFRAGKTAALVGASGSGKSTVISLVERFYDPLSGSVKLDGRDIKTLNLQWLRSQIGLVSQEPTLFATTIKGNVAHGLIGTKHENASDEEKFALIKEACIKSNADGFISKLPLGYDTLVGERGFLLSGGQKQRIAIARAIVSDPRILLLDEATSALDTQSEGVVQDALDKAAAGRTTITIAHRLSTIKDADLIYVMGEGVVLEEGTHDELIAKGDAYARLVQSQKLREAAEITEAAEDGEPLNEKPEDIEKAALEEIPLGRKNTGRSLASEILEQKQQEGLVERTDYGIIYLFRRMGRINSASWRNYLIGGISAIITGLVFPAYGIVYAKGINGFSEPDRHTVRIDGDRNALWFFLIAIVSCFAIGFQNYNFAASAATLTAKLRTLSFRAILRQDIEFFDRDENNTGALTSELSDNPQKVNGLAGITLGALVQSAATLIGGMIVGLIFAWKLGLVGLACTPFLVTTGYIRLRVVVLKDQANKKEHAASAQLACEAAASIRTVAALTREQDCCDLYSKSLEEPLRKSNRSAIFSNGLYAISQSMVFFAISLIFWYGSRLVSFGEFSTFEFFVGLMCSTFSSIQAGNVFSFVPDMSSAKGAATDIIKLLDSVPEIDAESTEGKRIDPTEVRGQIRFENIHFRYPTRPGVRVLRDLNLQIEPGTFIALVGQSGCGKSYCVSVHFLSAFCSLTSVYSIQMIERFYDPLAGQIYLDGEKISDLNVTDYRKAIALVSQEPTLYAGTVTEQELEDACRKANILEFIESLPQGFDTEVGGKGSQLSGGQKQRIAIARALLRNPKVLLLDEATSALDSNSEKVVQAALDEASKGRTTIAIAHRLSSIQNADRIYFIKEGAVSEAGTHDQLLGLKGDYYEFVQLQALSKRD
ncbi:multidrug resistance protein 1 [Gymnopus androsaceus JB14]|uniref:Multidrug resistance protein 1 n=1 Tax=Gymnopus androsaceus JB14 TaxID=1447944 RepID=A0A6A4HPS4_9AGAR|nr:multidrug resistance protein 1 [Gymnopus androsaceus JB14]